MVLFLSGCDYRPGESNWRSLQVHGKIRLMEKTMTILVDIVWKLCEWVNKRTQETLENRVLDTFGHRNWPWLSASGVRARMKHYAVYDYAAAQFPPQVTNWSSLCSRIRMTPKQLGYVYRRTFCIPSNHKLDWVLRDLFKRGLLACAPDNPSLYQLKH